jgi:uncharacterized protein (DUF983 family)
MNIIPTLPNTGKALLVTLLLLVAGFPIIGFPVWVYAIAQMDRSMWHPPKRPHSRYPHKQNWIEAAWIFLGVFFSGTPTTIMVLLATFIGATENSTMLALMAVFAPISFIWTLALLFDFRDRIIAHQEAERRRQTRYKFK